MEQIESILVLHGYNREFYNNYMYKGEQLNCIRIDRENKEYSLAIWGEGYILMKEYHNVFCGDVDELKGKVIEYITE